MHHSYLAKGDPLCPLGFHPQVRWPTRCKRCFRDYKEHTSNKKTEEISVSLRRNDVTASSPSLSLANHIKTADATNSWTSISNIPAAVNANTTDVTARKPSAWTSTPNLNEEPTVSFSIKLPSRKSSVTSVTDDVRKDERRDGSSDGLKDFLSHKLKDMMTNDVTNVTQSSNDTKNTSQAVTDGPDVKDTPKDQGITKTDSVKKLVKRKVGVTGKPKDSVTVRVKSKTKDDDSTDESRSDSKSESKSDSKSDGKITEEKTAHEEKVEVRRRQSDLRINFEEQIKKLSEELNVMKGKCEKLEREKSDILLRRLATYDAATTKTSGSEILKLQQKVNELQRQVEDLTTDKKSLLKKLRQIEMDATDQTSALEAKKLIQELQAKLKAAETLCEELMDENEDIKKELRELEEEMEEMQDNFREEQADEYTSLRKELEQTTKNCRVLSFKLRKAERKIEELESEKADVEKKMKQMGGINAIDQMEKIKRLEEELKISNEIAKRLQNDLSEATTKLQTTEEKNRLTVKRAPMLKNLSAEGRISRESLTRGDSQEDPQQLLRDLQDSMEREADLREQLRYAEEEAQNLRRKASRIEDDNESLVLQLKKMATKDRTRRSSPTKHSSLRPPMVDKDEGISDVEDTAELKLLLELSEQETGVLRKKIGEAERENEIIKKQLDELKEKTLARTSKVRSSSGDRDGSLDNQKVKVLEDELQELRRKLIEKDRECERLHTEITLIQKQHSRGTLVRSKSLDNGDPQTVSLKKQLESIEQEANVLRGKMQKLEQDNETLVTENKRLQLVSTSKKLLNSDLKKKKPTETSVDIKEKDAKIKEKDAKIKEYESEIEKLNKAVEDISQSKSEQAADELLTVKNALEQAQNAVKDLQKENRELHEQTIRLRLKNQEDAEKTAEVERLTARVKSLELTAKANVTKLKNADEKMLKIKGDLDKQQDDYHMLTVKYEELEEEHVQTKASLTLEREALLSKLETTHGQIRSLTLEVEALRNTSDHNEDLWLNERARLQERIATLEHEIQTNESAKEIKQLKQMIDEKQHEVQTLHRDLDEYKEQMMSVTRDNDELKRKLDDFDRVTQIKKTMADTTALEKDLRQMTNRYQNLEKMHKLEINQTKTRYEKQMNVLYEELESVQGQMTKHKKEKDDFKHMFERAQVTIRTLQQQRPGAERAGSGDADDFKTQVIALQEHVNHLEDELSEARLQRSKLTTELVSERSSWEVKISELQSKINELEEDRIISSGRSKIPGQRTRLELAWQKERDEQQRILQETSTLARDLRQTLYEVEREKDKERLESKRKIDQLKKTLEDEQDETRKKIADVQCDLLELRDAHAKLRTTNEKLRREKERYEKKYIEARTQTTIKRTNPSNEPTVEQLIDQINQLNVLLNDDGDVSTHNPLAMTPTPTKRTTKSRESSPMLERRASITSIKPDNHVKVKQIVNRLTELTAELNQKPINGTGRRPLEKASSIERNDTVIQRRAGSKGSSLHRKSLSLDQQLSEQTDQAIWNADDDSLSSIQSLTNKTMSKFDSRLSGDSVNSEIVGNQHKKKKRGLMGKLKNLAKSHSIDESYDRTRRSQSHIDSDSDVSVTDDMRSSKKDLRNRITNMFKRGKSSSRGNSVEKDYVMESSTHRPLMKIASSGAISKTSNS